MLSAWGGGQIRNRRTAGALGLLAILLSGTAAFAQERITCPNGEVRRKVDARNLAVQYEGWSMSGTLSSLSVLGARVAIDQGSLQQAAIVTQQWNEILQGLAAGFNGCSLSREHYDQALQRIYPRLKEDAAELEEIRKGLAEGEAPEEKPLANLLDSYHASLRRFVGLAGQDLLMERVAAVVELEGPKEQDTILSKLKTSRSVLEEIPRTSSTRLAEKSIRAAEAYEKGYHLFQGFRFQESLPYFEQALAEARVPELYASLGQVLRLLEQWDRAETMFLEGVTLARSQGDKTSEAELLFGLGQMRLGKRDFDGALGAARQALEVQRQVHGLDHPETATYSVLVGQILKDKGDLGEALEATRNALKITETVPGADPQDIARIASNLGSILRSQRDPEGAEEQFRRALKIFEDILGPDHSETILALANLGAALSDKGDLKGALEFTREALRRDEKRLGPDHLGVASRARNLCMILLEIGDLDEALRQAQRAHQIYQRSLEPGDYRLDQTASNLGWIFREKGNLETALSHAREALRISQDFYGSDHPTVAKRANQVAVILRDQGHLNQAQASVEQALRIDSGREPDSPDVARDSHTLAQILLDKRDLDQALEAGQRAVSLDEAKLGPDHQDVARDRDTLAAILLARGEIDEALRSARRALEIVEKIFGPENPLAAKYAHTAGKVLWKKGDLREARAYFERSLGIFEKTYGPDNPWTRKVAADLERIEKAYWKAILPYAAALIAALAAAGLLLARKRARPVAAPSPSSTPQAFEDPELTVDLQWSPVVRETSGGAPPRLGPYRLEDRVGAGGMGVVYRAYDERLDRWVAVKLLPPERSDDLRRERLRREARASARLNHPAIIQVFDFVHTDETDAIVMELVEGEALAELLRHGPLDVSRALPIALDIAEALAEAHSKEIVHRDLKAENVLVTSTWRAKVLDFGIAKRLDQCDPSLTSDGAVLGTFRTMSPEQALGHEVDHRSDLFSFGTLLYELFTGESPFLAANAAATMRRICQHQQPPAREIQPSLPNELSELIDRLLRKEPQHRPRDAREVAAALARIAASSTLAVEPMPKNRGSRFRPSPS